MATATDNRKWVGDNRHRIGSSIQQPYRSRETLLTPAERRFFTTGLVPAVGDRFHICPKVRLADVITCSGIPRSPAWRKIQAKHLAFVLMDPASGQISAAVELNDASHNTSRRRKRDAFVADALQAATVPLVTVPIYLTYDPKKLRHHVQRVINGLRRDQ